MARPSVMVTGMGVVSAIGCSVGAFFHALVSGRSGVRPLAGEGGLPVASVEFDVKAHFPLAHARTLDRFAQLGLVAVDEAVLQSKLQKADLQGPRVGVYFGSGLGGATAIDDAYRSFFAPEGRVNPMTVVLTMANAAAAHISIRYAIRGPSLTYSVACASSAVAIGEAFRAIRDGYIDVAIAGGAESIITPGSLASWKAMRVLATPDASHPEAACRPFSADRTGLVVGEGAGALVLESSEHAKRGGRAPLAEIAGYGIASDATNLAKPDADGQAQAMSAALVDAIAQPSDIGYINAHGTATPTGDVVETESIRKAFGATADRIPVSSTKALHGHLLGASGAVELIAALMALRTGTIPPTCHLEERDPQCDLDYVREGARRARVDAVMSNSFAFGGTNAVLVARRASAS